MADDVDLEDLPPKTLRKMIRTLRAKLNKKPGGDDEEDSGSEKEREDLADLHEDSKGKGHKQKVEKDDLPFDLNGGEADDESDEDDSSSDEEKSVPPKKNPKK
jgi:hypothetical protein